MGQQLRGVGADCARFVDAVLAELYGLDLPDLPLLDPDLCLHRPRDAVLAARAMAARYPNRVVRGPAAWPPRPGDVVLYRRGRAPGHVLIAGARPAELWHCDLGVGVVRTGLGNVNGFVMRVWQMLEKDRWSIR
jgi:hypothetical protein